MTKKKIHGQVFTPLPIVNRMLDMTGYMGNTVLSKTLWEPSFGEGVFLLEAVKRIIDVAETPQDALRAIQNNIYGVELDPELYMATVARLRAYTESRGVVGVDWEKNLRQGSALEDSLSDVTYDFVVGNPPYVRIHNIPAEDRDRVKSYRFTTGTTDLYIAFFELGLNRLKDDGSLVFITPNSFMKNVSQKPFRKFLSDELLISELVDYRDTKVFDDADTYATITVLRKGHKNKNISYTLEQSGQIRHRKIPYAEIKETAWNFADFDGVMKRQKQLKHVFSDKLKVQNGLATLRDKIFIDSKPVIGKSEGQILFNGHEVESGILRPIVKSSRYQGEEIVGRALYPYDGDGKPLSESTLRDTYPNAYNYLLSYKEELLSRDLDQGAQWYQYGRSQGIKSLIGKKYVMSPIISEKSKVKLFELSEDCLVYSGFFVTLHDDKDLSMIRKELASKEFISYAMLVGKDMSGGYVNIKPLNVKEYRY